MTKLFKKFLGYSESDPQPSTLGLGFDPSGIQPESGFKPILEQGGGLPTLAFSVLDGVGQPYEDQVQLYGVEQQVWKKMSIKWNFVLESCQN